MIKVNGIPIILDKFPNGETLVSTNHLNKYEGVIDRIRVEFQWFNDEDLLHLYFVLEHLTSIRASHRNIYFYYMPYSRMDRKQNGNCFTLRYVTRLLRECLTIHDKVYVLEPHSDVTLNLLSFSMNLAEKIEVVNKLSHKILQLHPEIDMICYPDKGAKERFKDDKLDLPIVFCNKVRDFDTGEIKGLELDGDIDVKDKNILILDDLCSKGGTFYHTANKLKENGANNIYLGVCHMEQTVKEGYLLGGKVPYQTPIKHIYCFDTMFHQTVAKHLMCAYDNITVFDTEEFLYNNQMFRKVLWDDV